MHTCIDTHTYKYIPTYIHMYIYKCREREKERHMLPVPGVLPQDSEASAKKGPREQPGLKTVLTAAAP